MLRFKKAVFMFLALEMLMSPFLSFSPALAQNQPSPPSTPTPTPLCILKYVNQVETIECTPPGGSKVTFRREYTGTLQNVNVNIGRSAEFWQIPNGPREYGISAIGIVVARDPGASANDFSHASAVALSRNIGPTGNGCVGGCIQITVTQGNVQNVLLYGEGVRWEDFYNVTTPPALVAKVNNLKSLAEAMKHGTIISFSGGNPSSSTQTKCTNLGLANQLNKLPTDLTALLDKLKAAFFQNLDAYAQKNPTDLPNIVEVKNKLTAAFDKQKNNQSILDDYYDLHTHFMKYYRSEGLDGKNWPTVVVTSAVLQQYSRETEEMYGADADANLPVKGIFGLRNKIMEMLRSNDIEKAVKAEVSISYSYFYLERNLKYRECAFNNNDKEYAQYDPAMTTQLQSIYDGTTTALQIHDEQGVCDKIGGGMKNLIKKGFCGLLVEMKKWADWLYATAKSWLEISLGVAENKDMNVPEDSAYSPDGGAGGGGGSPSGGAPVSGGSCGQAFDTSKRSKYETSAGYPSGISSNRQQIDWVVSQQGKNYAINTLSIPQDQMKVFPKTDVENMIRAEVVTQFNALSNKYGSTLPQAQHAVLSYASHEYGALNLFKDGKPFYVHDNSGDCTGLFSLTNDKFGANAKNKRVAASYDIHYTIYLGVREIMGVYASNGVRGTGEERWKNTVAKVFWPGDLSKYWSMGGTAAWRLYPNEQPYQCSS